MKMLIVLALSATFVAAEPEADPALLYTSTYGAYRYATHATGVYSYPYGAPVAYRAPQTYTNIAAVKTVGLVCENCGVTTYGAPITYGDKKILI